MQISIDRYVNISPEWLGQNGHKLVAATADWPFEHWSLDHFLIDLPRKWDYSFLLYNEDELQGMCIASAKDEEWYYIHLLFAMKRRAGVGSRMIDHVVDFCRSNGLLGAKLRCRESNLVARRFYDTLGFVSLESIQDPDDPEPDVLYELAVDDHV